MNSSEDTEPRRYMDKLAWELETPNYLLCTQENIYAPPTFKPLTKMPFLKENVACLLKLLKLLRYQVQILPVAVELSYYGLTESSSPGRNQANIRLE